MEKDLTQRIERAQDEVHTNTVVRPCLIVPADLKVVWSCDSLVMKFVCDSSVPFVVTDEDELNQQAMQFCEASFIPREAGKYTVRAEVYEPGRAYSRIHSALNRILDKAAKPTQIIEYPVVAYE